MIIYKDKVSGDEILSDTYDIKEVNGAVYEVNCAMINVGGESFDFGGNPSAEEGGDDVEDAVEKKIDIIHSFRLEEATYLNGDKKGWMSRLKKFMKKVAGDLKDQGASEEEISTFQNGVQKYIKDNIIKPGKKFDDFQCFTGESMHEDGIVVLLDYREDGITPYVIVWKHGLTEMKV